MKRFAQAQTGIGAALVLLGMTVMLGWVLRNAATTQIRPDMVGMVFNSAVCFALTGVALLLPSLRSMEQRWARTGQTLIGWALMAIALIVLAENVVDGNFGLDLPSLHAWLNDHNPRPGRMAFTSCLGFLLCGLALVLMHHVRRKAHGVIIQIATFAVFTVGLTGLFAYSLDLELLYPAYHSSRMPVHTALGMVLTSIGLWLNWNRADWYCSRRYFREDDKVVFLGAAVLIGAAFTAGVAAFSAQQNTLEKTFSDSLAALLKSRITLYQDVFRHSVTDAQAIAARPDLLKSVQRLRSEPDNHEALADLRAIGNGLLSPDVTGIVVYDAREREIMEFGAMSDASSIAVDLQLPVRSALFWNRGLYLNNRLEITDRGETIGFVVVERRLTLVTEHLPRADGLGQTGRIGMCISKPDHLWCFPKYVSDEPYRVPRYDATGKPLAMSHAIDGQFGIFKGIDNRGRNVIAAHGPVNASGLGLILKQDAQELYRPIREQLEFTIGLLLLLVAIGTWLLRVHIKPLTTRLRLSEQDACQRELKMRTVVGNVGEGIISTDVDGVIESFNNAASVIFGYTQAEAIGQNIRILIPEELRLWHDEGMRRYLEAGEQHIIGQKDVVMPGLRKEGTVIDIELTVNEMRFREQRSFVGIVRDITRRKQADEALRAAHAELETRVQQRTAELSKANEMLKMEVADRKRAEVMLRASQEKLRKVAAHQDRVKEEERKRIAREIHDELGGLLTGIKSYLSFAVESAARGGQPVPAHVGEAGKLADSAIETARRVITDLRPSVLDQLGLWAALEWQASQMEQRTGLKCNLLVDADADLANIDSERSIALFRIVQETLTNVVRHAKATNVNISASCKQNTVVIEMKDDGIGIEPQSLLNRDSWGIEGMYERARFFGGELNIRGVAGQGTAIVLRMPLEEVDGG